MINTKVKFVDLQSLHKPIQKEIDEAIHNTIKKSNFINGEEVQIFEEEFAKYTNQKYAIGVSSGYHALELSKESVLPELLETYGHINNLRIQVPTNSFIATANAFNDCPLYFKDINKDTHLMDETKLIQKDASIIVPVHLYGQPCNMEEIIKQSNKKGNIVIEDACQAHGVSSKLIGKGLTTCYSFYPSKNLGCFGDGGIVTTNDEEIAERIRLLRSYGEFPKNVHNIIGYNCRLDTTQAAILNVKLPYLDEWNNRRREIAKQYHEELNNITQLKLIPYNKESVYHLFVIEATDRDILRNFLSDNGIETGIHYPIPIHKQKAYQKYNTLKLPIAEYKSTKILSLPMYPSLREDEVTYVCDKIKEFYNQQYNQL